MTSRAALDEAAPTRDQAAQGARALIGDPHGGDQVGQQVGEHACVNLVGLQVRVADSTHLLGVREHDLGFKSDSPQVINKTTSRWHDAGLDVFTCQRPNVQRPEGSGDRTRCTSSRQALSGRPQPG